MLKLSFSTTYLRGAPPRLPVSASIGTLGLLLEAKRKGLLATLRPELDKLLASSFFLSEQLYDKLLRLARESEK